MATLGELLDAPGLRSRLVAIGHPPLNGPVALVALVESLDRPDLPSEAILVLTRGASAAADGYRGDMLVRLAAARRATALVFTDGRHQIPLTATTIAHRARLALFGVEPGTDLGGLVLSLHLALAGDAETALSRLDGALRALTTTEATGGDAGELVSAAADAFGRPFALRAPAANEISAPVIVRDPEDAVCTAARGGHDDTVARAAVTLTAAAVARVRAEQRRAEEIPLRSRGELLSEFLLAPPSRGDRLLERMRAVDLTVDGWHAVVRIEADDLDARAGEDELASFHLTARLSRAGLEAARASGGIWHAAQLGTALLLVRMERTDFGARGSRDTARAAQESIRRIVSREQLTLVCGVGGIHAGPTGLRTSAAEAQAAVAAARAARRCNAPVSFDEVGLRRTLLEWLASDTAREAVDSILRPLDRLDPKRSRTAIQTLQAYLDNQGSLARTAEQLHLHRNAVAYRIHRIFETLEVDVNDPDARLLLSLACRARALG